MPTPPLQPGHESWPKVEKAADLREAGWQLKDIAEHLNAPLGSIGRWLTAHKAHNDQPGLKRLTSVGYDLDAPEMTPQEAWDAGTSEFSRTISKSLSKRWQTIKRPRGPFVIAHFTDEHLDAPGCALKLLEEDIRLSHDMGAVMCHGGDALNNWPMAGRLAQQWAHQECTLPMALLRLQHFIDILKPDVWIDGNHEEMNPYLAEFIRDKLPKGTLTDYWTILFRIASTGGRDVRVGLSHKFGKGGSWFHKTHGHIREMLEGEECDVLLDGHLHSDGVMDHSLPERGISALAVASGGYKFDDKYARRISKSSGRIKIRGRAHWVVCDPQADEDENLATAFKSPQQAEACLNGLQNLRAV